MLAFGKVFCVALYALALAGVAGWIHGPLATYSEIGAALFIAVHVVEVVVLFRFVRLYPGGLPSSIVQTLLFGALHTLPLMRAAKARA